MLKKVLLTFAFLFFAYYPIYAESPLFNPAQRIEVNTLEPIKKKDRILVLAPHPDDETIGCAGIIQQAVRMGAKVRVAYLTNGDHNEFAFIVYEKRLVFRTGAFIHMGKQRRQEAINAMQLLGLEESNLTFFGYPDFGTYQILREYWQTGHSYKSMLTRISKVPYEDQPSYEAPYIGDSILADLEHLLLSYMPNKIFVSHPADVNGDHKAYYLFLQIALANLAVELPQPKIYPYLIHWVGWPSPRHYHPELMLQPPEQFLGSQIKWYKYNLNKSQLDKKHKAILCYPTQTQSSAFYLFSFARKNELFGDYPSVDLMHQDEKDKPINNEFAFLDKIAKSFNLINAFNKQVYAKMDGLNKCIDWQGKFNYGIKDNFFIIQLKHDKEVSRRFMIISDIFSYSSKTHFAAMPKLRLIAKYKQLRLFSAGKDIDHKGLISEFTRKQLVLKIPLEILNYPDFIYISTKAYPSSASLADAVGFRRVNIKRGI